MLRSPVHATSLVVLALAGSVFTMSCSRREVLAPRFVSPPPFRTAVEEEACPDDVAPEDCRAATEAERYDLWWDIQVSVKWYLESCAAIGYAMQEMASTGVIKVYP